MNSKSSFVGPIGGLVIALALTACGSTQNVALAPHHGLALMGNSNAVKPPGPTIDTSALAFTISPTSGPPGTPVRLQVTGCGDPSGTQHAVSYNDGNVGGLDANALAKVHGINMDVKGSDLNGQYNIPQKAAGLGVFYAQCGNSVLAATFTVTQ